MNYTDRYIAWTLVTLKIINSTVNVCIWGGFKWLIKRVHLLPLLYFSRKVNKGPNEVVERGRKGAWLLEFYKKYSSVLKSRGKFMGVSIKSEKSVSKFFRPKNQAPIGSKKGDRV